jgi:transcription antitermination factor NusG
MPENGQVHTSAPLEKQPDGRGSFPGRSWFAVYTTCRHEKRIAQHFEHREIEHYLPVYRTQRRWKDGSKVILDLPLFPSYIFVRIDRPGRANVLAVPGVLSIVGGQSAHSTPLLESEIEALRSGLDPRYVEPHPLLRVGCRARIRTGPLAGMEGVVVRKKGLFRVVLTLELIMQSIAVEVDGDDLEMVRNPSGSHSREPVL